VMGAKLLAARCQTSVPQKGQGHTTTIEAGSERVVTIGRLHPCVLLPFFRRQLAPGARSIGRLLVTAGLLAAAMTGTTLADISTPSIAPVLRFSERGRAAHPIALTQEQTSVIRLPFLTTPAPAPPNRFENEDVPEHRNVSIPVGPLVVNHSVQRATHITDVAAPIVIRSSIVLPAGSLTNQVSEPSVATKGNLVLFTANHFAALSLDGGNSFKYLSPFQAFNGTGYTFCCDQVVVYIPQIDTFVWSLQANDFAAELLLYATATELAAGTFHKLLLTPTNLGVTGGLDFTDMSVGTNMLYWSANVFSSDGASSVVARIPLISLKKAMPAPRATERRFGVRLTQNTGAPGYFAAHVNSSTLRVYAWVESAADPTYTDVIVPSWTETTLWGPVGSRVLGTTRTSNDLWFAWNAAPQNDRPFRYAAIVRINARTFTLADSPDLFNPDYRIGLPALGTNNVTGEVAIAYAFGDGMSEGVGLLTNSPAFVTAATGGESLSSLRWGDYLSVRQHYDVAGMPTESFDATGYTYNVSGQIEPRWIVLSRPSVPVSGSRLRDQVRANAATNVGTSGERPLSRP
jgi:hypothetical protein